MNISKTKRRRLAGSHGLEAFLGKHAAGLGRKLEEKLRPVLRPDEEMPNFVLALRLLGRHLAAQRARVEEAEARLAEARVDTRVVRKERATAEQETRRTFKHVKLIVFGTYARKDLEEIGFVGSTARRFFDLWRQGENVIARLKRPGFRLPASNFPGAEMSPQDLVEKLQPSVERLGVKIRAALDAERREEKARIVQKEAMKNLETDYARLGQIATALCYFLDQDWLAKRTHTALRRMDRRSKGGPQSTEDAPISDSLFKHQAIIERKGEIPGSLEPSIPTETENMLEIMNTKHTPPKGTVDWFPNVRLSKT